MVRTIVLSFLLALSSSFSFAQTAQQESPDVAHTGELCPTDEVGPGDMCYMHEVFHDPYEVMFRAINTDWISKNVATDKTFETLFKLRHLVNAVNGDDSGELGPGDYSFMNGANAPLRDLYIEMYKNTKCHCNYGSCRPTQVRLANPGEESKSGYMVFVNDQWEPVDPDVLHHENQIDPDLWYELMGPLEGLIFNGKPLNGHICKLSTGTTECVLTPRIDG